MKKILITVVLTFAFTAFAIQAVESTIFSAEGIIESTDGGFKYPDGTVQASAAFPATSTCTAITYVPYHIIYEGVYCFTGNIETSMDSLYAITIDVDNVTINMNGWKLDGSGAGDGTTASGFYAFQRKNITIRNGTIRGFYAGIALSDNTPYNTSQGHLIEDIRADMNTFVGLQIRGSGNTVRRNQIVGTGGVDTGGATQPHAYGIHLYGPWGRVLNNDISNTTALGTSGFAYGVRLDVANGAVVEGNRISVVYSSSATSSGINFDNSSNTLAVGNRIISAKLGIVYINSTGKYMDNLTSGITLGAFNGGTPIGTNN